MLSLFGRATAQSRVAANASKLGRNLAAAWRAHSFRLSAFPDIAAEHLADPRSWDCAWQEIIEWVICNDELPYQQFFDSDFGEPALTLYWHPRFYLQALFWASSTTAVHNHSFAGAFKVIEGSSLQTVYTFETTDEVAEQLHMGSLRVQRSEVLLKGTVHQIRPGPAFIHSVFHLDRPSVTLVARTHSDVDPLTRLEYLGPHVAYAPFLVDQQRTRRLDALALLRKVSPGRYATLAAEMVRASDAVTAFTVLRQDHAAQPTDRSASALYRIAKNRWARWTDLWYDVFLEETRQKTGLQLRGRILSPHLRLLIGLLLTQKTSADVVRQVDLYARSASPVHTLIGWIHELCHEGVFSFPLDRLTDDIIAAMIQLKSVDPLHIVTFVTQGGRASQTPEVIRHRVSAIGSTPILLPLFR